MSSENIYFERVGALYSQYRTVVKPLLACVEAEYEKFPTPIYNEIRSFTDHLSRCFTDDGELKPDDAVSEQCSSAEHHIKRAILDCYKLLLISSRERIERFERGVRFLDLRTIDQDGGFSYGYATRLHEAKELARKAKEIEATADTLKTYEAYQSAHNAYCSLEDYLDSNQSVISHAKLRFFAGKVAWIVVSILSFIAGNLLSNNNEAIVSWLLSQFG